MFSCPTFLCPGGLLPLLGPTLPCLMLDPDTDLREAPSNWLRRHPLADSLRGFDAARHYTAFSSFKMFANCIDYVHVSQSVALYQPWPKF